MSVFDALRQYGPCEAAVLADVLGMPLEDVYEQLVLAESVGLAKITTHANSRFEWREWQATV